MVPLCLVNDQLWKGNCMNSAHMDHIFNAYNVHSTLKQVVQLFPTWSKNKSQFFCLFLTKYDLNVVLPWFHRSLVLLLKWRFSVDLTHDQCHAQSIYGDNKMFIEIDAFVSVTFHVFLNWNDYFMTPIGEFYMYRAFDDLKQKRNRNGSKK